MDYLATRKQFDATHAALTIPAGCYEPHDPVFSAITQYSWIFEWHLMFTDNKYVRIWEDYCRVKGLQESRRARMAYHYGAIPRVNTNGIPQYIQTDPVDIRIDNSCQRIHLHFGAPNPHIFQENVEGLDLAKMDIFTFVQGIFKHRKTGKALDKVFGFKII